MTMTRYAFCLCLLGLAACGKMDEPYADIIRDGEIIYTARADSLQAFPGQERVALSWLLFSDPSITHCIIYWTGGDDSLRVPVKRGTGTDTIRAIVENLAEGSYLFSVVTGDDQGHRSVEAQVSGQSYGDQYASTLFARPLVSARWTDGNTRIIWEPAVGDLSGTLLEYTATDGTTRRLQVPATQDTTEIPDLREGSTLSYQTLFLPDSLSVDTFYTAPANVSLVFEESLDKALFAEHALPGDAVAGYGWVESRLWDGSVDAPNGFFCTADGSNPIQFTIDLGTSASLGSYTLWQRGLTSEFTYLYSAGNLKQWEVWGATDPDPGGGWEGWTKLLDCQSLKPSGLPLGQVSDADKAYAAAGETFIFPDTLPAVRYLRFRMLTNWGGAAYAHPMEITVRRLLP